MSHLTKEEQAELAEVDAAIRCATALEVLAGLLAVVLLLSMIP